MTMFEFIMMSITINKIDHLTYFLFLNGLLNLAFIYVIAPLQTTSHGYRILYRRNKIINYLVLNSMQIYKTTYQTV